jgi:hypothetical protein
MARAKHRDKRFSHQYLTEDRAKSLAGFMRGQGAQVKRKQASKDKWVLHVINDPMRPGSYTIAKLADIRVSK